MKIDFTSFFDHYKPTETDLLDLPPDEEVDVERIKNAVMTRIRREERRKKLHRAATILAATAAVVALVFFLRFDVTKKTVDYNPPFFASEGQEEEKNTVTSWIWDFFNSLKSKKIGYGEQEKEPGMNDWNPAMQGMLLEFDDSSESESESEPESESESESQAPAYLEGPAVGEKIWIAAFQFGYLPESGHESRYDARSQLQETLTYYGYSQQELQDAWGKKDLTQVYTYVTKEYGETLDYMIQMIQPYEVETRTFSFRGEVTIVKNEMLGEWEATWLTVNEYLSDSEDPSSEETEPVPYKSDHYLLLYHPEKHYLLNLSVDATVHAMEELDKMAADIVVVDAEMAATKHMNESVAYPDQTFNLNAARG